MLEQFGPGNLIIPIFSFFQYSQVLGSRRAFDFLYTHLTHPEVADEILEIIPRGWCLIEIELYTENQSHEDVDENCNCTYVNQLTGHEIMNPPSGVHPSVFDPTWFNYSIQQHKWRINYLNNDGTVIHGSPGESGTTVYHFWAWCEDEVGQDPWAHSWATNLEPTGGGGGPINTGPDWSYNKPRWNENTMDCMFAFNHPFSTGMINQLGEALLTASCGEAAEYNVKSIIDNIVMGLCNEYYDNQEAQGGEFPQFPTSPPHDIHETLEAITLGVESSSYYQIGQQICEVCDNALNPGQCYEAVNNCGTEGYEVCVWDVLIKIGLCGTSTISMHNLDDNLGLIYEANDCAIWEEPCWREVLGEHSASAVFFEDWCQNYSGFGFEDLNERGWFGPLNSQGGGPDLDWRYVIDPMNNNYVIDMRHLLYVGYYLEKLTGTGNAAGDLIELGQLNIGHTGSALNWQDFFSNRIGSAFRRYLEDNDDVNSENFVEQLCSFLQSPGNLYLRPTLNDEAEVCN